MRKLRTGAMFTTGTIDLSGSNGARHGTLSRLSTHVCGIPCCVSHLNCLLPLVLHLMMHVANICAGPSKDKPHIVGLDEAWVPLKLLPISALVRDNIVVYLLLA